LKFTRCCCRVLKPQAFIFKYSPKSFDLSICLRTVRSCIDVLDSKYSQPCAVRDVSGITFFSASFVPESKHFAFPNKESSKPPLKTCPTDVPLRAGYQLRLHLQLQVFHERSLTLLFGSPLQSCLSACAFAILGSAAKSKILLRNLISG